MTRLVHNNPLDRAIVALASRAGTRAREVERFLRFSVVVVIGAVVDLGTLTMLQATLLPPTSDLRVQLATGAGFMVAVINNFLWNRYWTYPDSRSRSIRRQLAQFTLVNAVGLIVRTTLISVTYAILGSMLLPAALPLIRLMRPGYQPSYTAEAKVGTMAAWLIAVIIVMLWNFFVNRYWTYSDVGHGPRHRH
ncbi:MAG: GtrA family protein [Anaerolineae bacterium]|nr:GtrA family protein [Anaerolineae bacterium]